MSDREPFLRAIAESPDDDLPALVYADWLESRGTDEDGARAEYVRRSCELARFRTIWARVATLRQVKDRLSAPVRRYLEFLPAGREFAFGIAWDDRQPVGHFVELQTLEAGQRVAAIDRRYGKAWRRAFEKPVLNFGLRRGFVDRVTIYSKSFLTHAEKMFAVEPVRKVRFAAAQGTRGLAPARKLFSGPGWTRTCDVRFHGPAIDDDYFQPLLESPAPFRLQALRLNDHAVAANTLAAVVASDRLPYLRELELGTAFGPCPIDVLLRSPGVSRLSGLSLVFGYSSAENVKRLCGCSHLSGLTKLTVWPGRHPVETLKAAGATLLPLSPHLRNLRELRLQGHDLRLRGTIAFARAANWPYLTRLSLRGNQIPPGAIPAFVENPSFVSLRELDLTSNPVTQSDVTPIRNAYPNLQVWTDDFHT